MKIFIQSLIIILVGFARSSFAFAKNYGYEHHERFESEAVIVTIGILTLISMVLTVLMGFFIPKNRKLLFLWHRKAALATLILGVLHALMVLLLD